MTCNRDRIEVLSDGTYGFKDWIIQYIPFNGRVRTLTLFGQKRYDTRREAQTALTRFGGANSLKRKIRSHIWVQNE